MTPLIWANGAGSFWGWNRGVVGPGAMPTSWGIFGSNTINDNVLYSFTDSTYSLTKSAPFNSKGQYSGAVGNGSLGIFGDATNGYFGISCVLTYSSYTYTTPGFSNPTSTPTNPQYISRGSAAGNNTVGLFGYGITASTVWAMAVNYSSLIGTAFDITTAIAASAGINVVAAGTPNTAYFFMSTDVSAWEQSVCNYTYSSNTNTTSTVSYSFEGTVGAGSNSTTAVLGPLNLQTLTLYNFSTGVFSTGPNISATNTALGAVISNGSYSIFNSFSSIVSDNIVYDYTNDTIASISANENVSGLRVSLSNYNSGVS